MSYEQGWQDAFDALAKYIEAEVCPITGQMIRRMKDEKWRFLNDREEAKDDHGAEPEEEQGD